MSAAAFAQTMDGTHHLRDSVAITQAETATALLLCSVSPSYSASILRHASASTTSARPYLRNMLQFYTAATRKNTTHSSAEADTCTRAFLLPSVTIFATFPATTMLTWLQGSPMR